MITREQAAQLRKIHLELPAHNASVSAPICVGTYMELLDTLDHLFKENAALFADADLHRGSAQAMEQELVRLRRVAVAARALDRYWFDPSTELHACITCEANLHPNCMGKHDVIEGTGCDLNRLHAALAELGEPEKL